MTVEPLVFTAVSAISGIVGTVLFVKSKLAENEDVLTKHIDKDSEHHASVLDRLARLETKINILLERRS